MRKEEIKEVLAEYGVSCNDWVSIYYHGLNLGYYTGHLTDESKLSLIAHFVINGKIRTATNKDELRSMLSDAVKFVKEWEINDKLTTMKQDFDD